MKRRNMVLSITAAATAPGFVLAASKDEERADVRKVAQEALAAVSPEVTCTRSASRAPTTTVRGSTASFSRSRAVMRAL